MFSFTFPLVLVRSKKNPAAAGRVLYAWGKVFRYSKYSANDCDFTISVTANTVTKVVYQYTAVSVFPVPNGSDGHRAEFSTAVFNESANSALWSYFAQDSGNDIHVNRRNASGSWSWTTSPVAIPCTAMPSCNSSIAVGAVLQGSSAFRNSKDGLYYNKLMYFVYQPSTCDGVIAGFLYASFSNNGLSWTVPQQVTLVGGPSFGCFPGHANTVPVEAVDAVKIGSTIKLVALEGQISLLANLDNYSSTLTNLFTATTNDPLTITRDGQISGAGIINYNILGWNTFKYFPQVTLSYESPYVYLGRAYPYGFNGGQDVSSANANYPTSCSSDCASGIATFPTRVQIYRMNVGNIVSNFNRILTGTWILLKDWGNSQGYKYVSENTCVSPGLQGIQQNNGLDFGSVNFYKKEDGRLFDNHMVFLGTEAHKSDRTTRGVCYPVHIGTGIYQYRF